ncbi:MAG: hypothetical protein ABSF70_07590 [Terracidiphilus sp.]|jgi:hypothetical protein
MNFKLKIAAAAILAVSVVPSYAQTGDTPPPEKKHETTRRVKTPPPPSVADQIQELREELQRQINSLKSDLAAKDEQLQKAQQAAAEAQAAAAKAEAAAATEQQAVTDNAAAVTTLQTSVTDLKGNQASLATTVSDETAKIKKDLANPTTLHYKGINLTPGGFLAGETVYRSKATGGDIPTAFSGIPYEGADAYSLSEFYGSARQSRASLMAEGKTGWGTLRGYYEADWLGTGITSNNNQSNSYVLRQRVLWAQGETSNHLAFTGGQLWSLATEDKKGISNLSGDIMTPQTIDPNYVAGFVWTRQYGFRVTKTFDKVAFGFAAENPQLLYSAALAGSTPYAILGSAGANGGNYNAAVSTVGATTYVKSYANLANFDAVTGNQINSYIPTYATITANTNITNISFNQAPDLIFKAAIDPGWGHYEILGIAGFAHETVYPRVTQNSVKYGGVADNVGFNCGTVVIAGCNNTVAGSTGAGAPGTSVWLASSVTGYYTSSIMLGGFGASARVPIVKDKLTFGVKGLYGPGMGRYGDTTLSDVTNNANGELRPIHNASGLFTLEATPTPRLLIYLNYGGDYASRADYATTAITLTDPKPYFCEAGGTNCVAAATATTAEGGGAWGSHFTTAAAIAPIGYGSRYASVSATCAATPGTPGYQSGSTGYLPGGSGCGNNTRDVQEITGGYWFDIYKGDRGRLRQSFQYGYAVREGWSGTGTAGTLTTPLNGAKGIDNMFWTSFRYYLP